MSNVIGIDIGARGALALLSPAGELLDVADMPILRDGPANRPNVNAPLLASIVRRWQASQAFVEYVGARPKEGPTGAFAFGRSKGVIEGVCAAAGLPVAFLTPPFGSARSAFRRARMVRRTRPARKPSDDGRARPNCSRASKTMGGRKRR